MEFGTRKFSMFNLLHEIYFQLYRLFFNKRYINNMNFRSRTVSLSEASLIGYDNLECIFVHIPKTAGISITSGLFQNIGGSHRTIKNYLLYFNNKDFNNYYKFCFVRNPWDRLLSSYFFLKAGGLNETDANWAKKHLANCNSFEDFVTNYLEKDFVLDYIHFKPQFEFICINNKIIVNKVYRYEDIKLSIEDINKVLNIDIALNHHNKSSNKKIYKDYYNDHTMKTVAKLYKKDIDLFKYKF